jgi:hypothetical protein
MFSDIGKSAECPVSDIAEMFFNVGANLCSDVGPTIHYGFCSGFFYNYYIFIFPRAMGLPVMFYVFTGLKIDSFSGVRFFEKVLPYEKSVNNVAGRETNSVQFNLHAFFLLLYSIKKV